MKEISWTACLRLGVTAAVVYLICAGRETLAAFFHALSPLLLGGGIACVVNIPMAALERRLFPRGGRLGRLVCMLLAFVAVAVMAAALAGVILPEALRCVRLLAARLPEQLSRVKSLLQAASLPGAGRLSDWPELTQLGAEFASGGPLPLLKTAAGALTGLARVAVDVLLALILAVYLLLGKERIAAQLTRLARRVMADASLARIRRTLRALQEAFRSYVAGQCAEALILGCLCLIGMLLLRLPGALPISAMAGVTTLLPLIGAPLAAGVGAVLLLPEGLGASVIFAVFFVLLQQLESGFIGPRVVGSRLGLPPVWTLAAMVAGGGLFGVAGAVLAVPVASAARTLLLECDCS